MFALRRNADGSVERKNARLLAKELTQIPGVDLAETDKYAQLLSMTCAFTWTSLFRYLQFDDH